MLFKRSTFLKQICAVKDLSARFASTTGSSTGSSSSNTSSDPTSKDVAFMRSQKFPNSLSSALKRGTGGRSSFNGTVVTVFGSNGFIGSGLIAHLCRMGCQVIVPYRGDHALVLRHKVQGDLGQVMFTPYSLWDDDSIYKAVKYANVVINLVGSYNATPNFSLEQVHVDGARKIARAAREAGCNRLLHVSSLNATPNPKAYFSRNGSDYLRTKYYGELAVREEFPEAIVFRPSNVYGRGDNFIRYWTNFLRLNGINMYMWNRGFGTFKQPVYCNDLWRAMVNSIFDNQALGKTVDAVGPNRYEYRDLVQYIMRASGRGEEYNYEIGEIRSAALFLARAWWFTATFTRKPKISLDLIELEPVTDVLTPGNLSLQDLGVTLTQFTEVAYYLIKPHSRISFYEGAYDFKEPPHPKETPLTSTARL